MMMPLIAMFQCWVCRTSVIKWFIILHPSLFVCKKFIAPDNCWTMRRKSGTATAFVQPALLHT